MSIETQRILLGITGGIAACKTPALVRLLKISGADVRICMTKNAHQFVTPLTLHALSGHAVVSNQFAPEQEDAMDHIAIARWADLILIAPATAGAIARFANGIADDLLTTIIMASEAPKVLVPAMNKVMWQQPQLQHNLELLKGYGWQQLPIGHGDQACGEYGEGRMIEPEQILECIETTVDTGQKLAGVRVLITAGSTREPIDPVRFIGNHSSGKMGYALAQAATKAGAQVTLISGYASIQPPVVHELVKVATASEMYDQVMRRREQTDLFIASAAVADYRPAQTQTQKIKKSELAAELKLQKTIDIVASFSANKLPGQYVIGFAAETDKLLQNARYKLKKKNLDMVVANAVGVSGQGFDSDHNQATLITGDEEEQLPKMRKTALARKILDAVVQAQVFAT